MGVDGDLSIVVLVAGYARSLQKPMIDRDLIARVCIIVGLQVAPVCTIAIPRVGMEYTGLVSSVVGVAYAPHIRISVVARP